MTKGPKYHAYMTKEEEDAISKGMYVEKSRIELEWLIERKLSDKEWDEQKQIYEEQWENK